MDRLWAPWRLGYVAKPKKKGCVFCHIAKENNDRQNHIFLRSKFCFAVLNTYPYNNGHYMVIPYRHIATPLAMTKDEACDINEVINKTLKMCQKAIDPQGFNIGMNVSTAAGAGIAKHIHTHIVPRWTGDANFMPSIAGAKVIPQNLNQVYKLFIKQL